MTSSASIDNLNSAVADLASNIAEHDQAVRAIQPAVAQLVAAFEAANAAALAAAIEEIKLVTAKIFGETRDLEGAIPGGVPETPISTIGAPVDPNAPPEPHMPPLP